MLPGIAVDVEHRPIARQTAGGDAKVEAALSHVVEHCDAVGEFRRMVIGQQEPAGGEPDMARLHQGLRDQQIGRGMRFPRRGVVLTDPAFAEAEFVGPAQGLKVPSMTLEEAAFRRMRRHRKQAVLHQDLPAAGFSENSLSRASGQPRI